MKKKPIKGMRILFWAGEVVVQDFDHDTQYKKVYIDSQGKRYRPSEEDILKDFQDGNGFKEFYDNTFSDGFIREENDKW